MTESEHSGDLSSLLQQFSNGNEADWTFSQLVKHLGGLVYHSALRQCHDASLAEEITQTVFLTMARKAKALTKHPSILAWVHKTTRLETLQAMRAHKRRLKREEQAMQNFEQPDPHKNQALLEELDTSLECLSTSERELVLMKYFENRTYQSITKITGRSKSAEKMKLKRALEKLSRWFGKRGITFSATTLAAALSAEFAKGAPAAVTQITAASVGTSTLTSGQLITHTLATMNSTKLATGTTLIVIAALSMPISQAWQDLQQLEQHSLDLDSPPTRLQERKRTASSTRTINEVVNHLIEVPKETFSTRELADQLVISLHNDDQITLQRIDRVLAQLDLDELRQVAIKLNDRRAPLRAMEYLEKYLPEEWNEIEIMFFAISVNANASYVADSLFNRWSQKSTLKEREEWLNTFSGTTKLQAKSSSRNYEGALWSKFLHQLTTVDAPAALAYLPRLTFEQRQQITKRLAPSIAREDRALAILTAQQTKGTSRRYWIEALISHSLKKPEHDHLTQWLKQHGFTPKDQDTAIKYVLSNQKKNMEFPNQIEWLRRNASPTKWADYLSSDLMVDYGFGKTPHPAVKLRPGVVEWFQDHADEENHGAVFEAAVNRVIISERPHSKNSPSYIAHLIGLINDSSLQQEFAQKWIKKTQKQSPDDLPDQIEALEKQGITLSR